MSFFTILDSVFLGPLKLLFETIFVIVDSVIGHPGLAIVFLSLAMNFLVLPLYKRADAMQEEARDAEEKLHKGVAHIKKSFSGDERMMMLQTYYRQNNYKPTDAIKGSVSLLLEIPFFMAAYQFLSGLETLQGVSLGPIADLGAPDALFVIAGTSINFLPILMTLINVISCVIYLKGFPLKAKIQLYGMALFFLVFLYASPSGLVFYWTLNNVFSLVKNIFYKLKKPGKVLCILAALMGIAVIVFAVQVYTPEHIKSKLFLMAFGVALMLPLPCYILYTNGYLKDTFFPSQHNPKVFLLGSVFLTVLVGLLIPSNLIADCPQEFIDPSSFYHPLWYVGSALFLGIGTFLIWFRVFYWLASTKVKALFDRAVWILSGVMLVNYMFFGTKQGIISATLQYEDGLSISWKSQAVNLLVIMALAAILYVVAHRWHQVVVPVLLTAAIALGSMSAFNVSTIWTSIKSASLSAASDMPVFPLSRTGQNVVIVMLDRAVGQYVPYMFHEKPELQQQFAGFTYYENTISFGRNTMTGSPALLGGYEYTPVEMNRRSEETMVEKHNEAAKVLPVLFSENDFSVTVCDVPLANYQWVPDLSIYDDYPEIQTYITKGQFSSETQKAQIVETTSRNIFYFSLMKSMPLCLQQSLYNRGSYNQAPGEATYSTQKILSPTSSRGLSSLFMNSYHVLENFPNITEISDSAQNTFLFINNEITHEPMLLQEPEYKPSFHVDNAQYDADLSDRFSLNGKTLDMSTAQQRIHYQTNMAAMIQLGKWFDYLRENGVYDNTRIILVSDHGTDLFHMEEFSLKLSDRTIDLENYFPLLMVKDFGSQKFSASNQFMTNADTPSLAVDGLIADPVNPFTGAALTSLPKSSHSQLLMLYDDWVDGEDLTFLPSKWVSVSDNIWELSNWSYSEELTILSRHEHP